MLRIAAMLIVIAAPAIAQQVPLGADPQTGARPGNDIGTGMSLPLSDKSSNITSQDTTSTIAPNLPSPAVGENASAKDYLAAARTAVLLDRTGEAQQALEMAETRALDRSVPLFQTNTQSRNPLVEKIEAALNALSSGDRGATVKAIEAALATANQPETE